MRGASAAFFLVMVHTMVHMGVKDWGVHETDFIDRHRRDYVHNETVIPTHRDSVLKERGVIVS